MTPEDFDYVSNLIKERSGLVLTNDKMYLLESRLMPVAREHGLVGLEAVVAAIRAGNAALVEQVVEAMTTNESFFFRDSRVFDVFRDVIVPAVSEKCAARKQLRIWCAAASSGQEPYTIAMILKEMETKFRDWRIDIVGTDISAEVLERARDGLYTQFEVQRGLPIQLLMKYFDQDGAMWRIKDTMRSMVDYREFNLLEGFESLGTFDIVLCRNVLIYFDRDTKANVLDRIANQLQPGGVLFLGGAETVLGLCDRFATYPGQRGIYHLDAPGAAAAPEQAAQAPAPAQPAAPAPAAPSAPAPAPASTPAAPAPGVPAAPAPRAAPSTPIAPAGAAPVPAAPAPVSPAPTPAPTVTPAPAPARTAPAPAAAPAPTPAPARPAAPAPTAPAAPVSPAPATPRPTAAPPTPAAPPSSSPAPRAASPAPATTPAPAPSPAAAPVAPRPVTPPAAPVSDDAPRGSLVTSGNG